MNWKAKYNKDELLREGLITEQEHRTWDYKHQLRLAVKRQLRRDIADMCGTSYAAACRDMGLSRQ